MENQHRLIKSYRDLNAEEIALINEIKSKEQELLDLIQKVNAHLTTQTKKYREAKDNEAIHRFNVTEPYRWSAISKTDFERGFMALVRSVAQPYNGPQEITIPSNE